MKLFLQPNDTFFFRDGRPFTKGDQSEGYSIFPPPPSTILGALRTAYIAEHGDLPSFDAGKMAETIGTPNSLGFMRLKGVFLADRNSGIYYPIPLDLVVKEKENDNILYPLEVCPNNANLKSNASLSLKYLLRWNGKEDVEAETSGKLKPIYMQQYLLGKDIPIRFNPNEDFICDEPKIGIQRSRETLASEDNMLYRINMSRFQSRYSDMATLGFIADYECNTLLPDNKGLLPDKGLFKLGGEGKSFLYELSKHNPDPFPTEDNLEQLKKAIKESGAFKLYFATPAIFKNGWLPKTNLESIELVTAAVGKSVPIGGWNMKEKKPKPTRRAVPAGSVYYCKILEGCCVDDVINTFHYQNISDYQAKEGYGLCFVGVAEGLKL